MYAIYLSLFICVLPQSLSEQYCNIENKSMLICNYFPREIPNEVSHVKIQNFRKSGTNITVNASFFSSKNWKFVIYLELINDESSRHASLILSAGCFTHLQMLSEIHLHVSHIVLSADAFIGTNLVKVLNMRACIKLHLDDFLASLNGTNKLPHLEVLDISRMGYYVKALVIDFKFINILKTKRIKDLTIIATEISYCDLGIIGNLMSLKKLNMSHSQISYLKGGKRFNASDFRFLKTLDFSYLNLPKYVLPPPGNYKVVDANVAGNKVINFLNVFFPTSINLTSILPRTTSMWIRNCIFKTNKSLHHITTRELVIKENNLKYLDLRCINNSFSSIEVVDISDNALELISPFISSCFLKIYRINLSNNQLFKMAARNLTLFSKIVQSFSHLKSVSFSGNNLNAIPYHMFANSSALEEIDLSNNNLQQVTFTLIHLVKLKILNLGSNLIHILNDVSINRLDSIPFTPDHDKNNAVVILTSNNIFCSKCDAKHFIQWILKTRFVNVTSQGLQCSDDDDKKTYITKETVTHLKYLCHLELYIILSCSMVILFIIIVLMFAYKLYKRRLLIKEREHRYNVIERLRGGNSHYKYACYLVYTLEDTVHDDNQDEEGYLVDHDNIMTRDFVENNFLVPLERHLEHEIEVDRQFVCSDEDAYGGRSDFNVFSSNLASSSAVVVIASQTFFSNALFCWMLEQVIAQEKYIIFLIKDGATYIFKKEETKRIFKNSKMFKWKIEDGEVILKSSWKEVCISIFDITSLSETE